MAESVLKHEVNYSRGEHRKELELVSEYNLEPMQEFTVGLFLIARNWERQTGNSLLSLSVEDIVSMFGRLPMGGR